MTLQQSPFEAAYLEFARQVRRLTRPGVVKTWAVWDGEPTADDPPAASMMPWVRLTLAGISGERLCTTGDQGVYGGESAVEVEVEVQAEGFRPGAVLNVWQEIRRAIFSDDAATRVSRDAALEAAGVVDVQEAQPVSTQGPQSFENGVVSGVGRVTLIVHTGV